jgi:hypothetical protein
MKETAFPLQAGPCLKAGASSGGARRMHAAGNGAAWTRAGFGPGTCMRATRRGAGRWPPMLVAAAKLDETPGRHDEGARKAVARGTIEMSAVSARHFAILSDPRNNSLWPRGLEERPPTQIRGVQCARKLTGRARQGSECSARVSCSKDALPCPPVAVVRAVCCTRWCSSVLYSSLHFHLLAEARDRLNLIIVQLSWKVVFFEFCWQVIKKGPLINLIVRKDPLGLGLLVLQGAQRRNSWYKMVSSFFKQNKETHRFSLRA